MTSFAAGTVGHTLTLMNGVWHDHCEVFSPSGEPLAEDGASGTPGSAPWDNLVYVDFDGENYRQTNVTFKGRPLHERTFHGKLVEGVLYFAKLGPDDPDHVGYSGGPGVLFFSAKHITDAWQRYAEPDCIRLLGPGTRTRTTLLYRNGVAVRCLTANGHRLAPLADRRVPTDPRGVDGPVHGEPKATLVFQKAHAP